MGCKFFGAKLGINFDFCNNRAFYMSVGIYKNKEEALCKASSLFCIINQSVRFS
jgi:hypothetical protein